MKRETAAKNKFSFSDEKKRAAEILICRPLFFYCIFLHKGAVTRIFIKFILWNINAV